MEQFKNFYITTPVYYVNDKPHIGHMYTSLLCDTFARFMRLAGKNIRFTTGTDEHGQKIEKAAQIYLMHTKKFTDRMSLSFKKMAKLMNFQYNKFIRTTEECHKKAVVALWNRLKERGQIYLNFYTGWYSVRDEAFYQESELINGKAPTGSEVKWVKEESYFFRLSNWQNKLLKLYENRPSFVFPESKKNEAVSFIKSGLVDLSISRTSLNWGVKVPGNEKHIIYVWIDALVNYLTSVGFPNIKNKKYKDFWENDDSYILHVIGKDILRFHAVYWPAILFAADLPLPKQIAVHGWWLNEGEKISKSIGNIIDPIKLAQEFGVDQIRYFFLREGNFAQDSNFNKKNIIKKINSELANNIGNLIQRTIVFLQKECFRIVPTDINEDLFKDKEKLPNYQLILQKVMGYLLKYEFNRIILLINGIASEANAYINESAPWILSKTKNRKRMNLVIYKLLEYIRIIGILLQPIVPKSADLILNQLQIPKEQRDLNSIRDQRVKLGTKLPSPTPIFLRLKPTLPIIIGK